VQARDEYEILHAEFEAEAELAKVKKEAARDNARKALKKGGSEVSAADLRVELPAEPTLRRYTRTNRACRPWRTACTEP